MLRVRRGRRMTIVAIVIVAALAWPAASAAADQTQPGPSTTQFGLTVSWLPTNTPVDTRAGETTHATFWVTNQTANPIPVSILPAIAIPGDNGALTVRQGSDGRFAKLSYSPDQFIAQPGSTTAVQVTTVIPDKMGPGVYLVPGLVRPSPPDAKGNIRTQQEIVAPVTFQIPGSIDVKLAASFLRGAAHSGGAVYHLPWLPEIQIASAGSTVLRVLNESTTSLYSYNEVISAQGPFGTAAFDGHTPGVEGDLRTDPALYFPGRHRDYAIRWSPSPLGIGLAHLTAYVSYHPEPATVKQQTAATDVLVISPWWLFAPAAYLLVLLAAQLRRTSRASKRVSGRRSKHQRVLVKSRSRLAGAVQSAVLALVIGATALFGELPAFAAVAGAAVAVAATGFVVTRNTSAVRTAGRIFGYQALSGLMLAAAMTALLLTIFLGWPVGLAIGMLSAAGVWALLAYWGAWWNQSRPPLAG